MAQAQLGDAELEYEISGEGEPVLLVHGGIFAYGLAALCGQDAMDGLRLIRYSRRGHGASSAAAPGMTPAAHADDAVRLLDHFGIDQAHIVGHSYGANVAIEIAALHPHRARSLALLEPPQLSGPAGEAFAAAVAPVMETYASGDAEGAVAGFCALVGPDWRTTIEQAVPGGVEQGVRDARTMFECDLPGGLGWSFDRERGDAVTCPVLSVLGTATAPLFVDGRNRLHEWFARCEDADVPGRDHLFPMSAPAATAHTIATFIRSAASKASVA